MTEEHQSNQSGGQRSPKGWPQLFQPKQEALQCGFGSEVALGEQPQKHPN
jgi:hypothetical protein